MRNWVGHHTLSVVWLSAYEMGEYSLLPNNVEKTIYLEKTCTYKHAHTCVHTKCDIWKYANPKEIRYKNPDLKPVCG